MIRWGAMLAVWLGLAGDATAAAALDVNGSTTVAPVVVRAAESLTAKGGAEIRVDTQGGSSGGIAALGRGRVDVAMSSRPLTRLDREKYPGVDFRPVRIGTDAVALVVSPDVWHSGVRELTREQVRGIYEKRITRWSALGGPDRAIVFFNKEPGRGTWEVFASWLYGNARQAPLVSHREVGSNEEARTKVAGTRGAVTQLSAAWADGERVFALGLVDGKGEAVRPDALTIANGRYPMARPLLVVTDGPPPPAAKQLIDFLLGEAGRRLVVDNGYLLPDVAAGP
jgi:phosphate transport system substrate-binding protein